MESTQDAFVKHECPRKDHLLRNATFIFDLDLCRCILMKYAFIPNMSLSVNWFRSNGKMLIFHIKSVKIDRQWYNNMPPPPHLSIPGGGGGGGGEEKRKEGKHKNQEDHDGRSPVFQVVKGVQRL